MSANSERRFKWKLPTYSPGASREEPCQDISLAGKGAGLAGARSGLWFEYLRLIRELRPRFVVAENVAALVARGLDVVLGGLAESGYDSLWLPIRASDVGAPHRRERIFIVAWRMEHPDRIGTGRFSGRPFGTQTESRRTGSIHGSDHLRVDVSGSGVADADSQGLERWSLCGHGRADEWAFGADGSEVADSNSVRELQQERSERDIGGRTVDGGSAHEWPPGPTDAAAWGDYITRHPGRVPAVDGKLNPGFVEALMGFPDGWTEPGGKRNARLKMLGNAVVPQCAEVIGHVVNGLAETEVAP